MQVDDDIWRRDVTARLDQIEGGLREEPLRNADG
jgi:hypothetical protein